MATLRPSVIVVGFDGIDLLVAGFVFATVTLSVTACHDTERRQFLQTNQFIGHHIGTTNLKPALDGVVLAWDKADAELRFALGRTITAHLLVQVVAHHTMCDVVGLVHIVECGCRVIADAGLETVRGGQVHVLRIGHGGAIDKEIIGEGLVDALFDLLAPHTVAVALHSDGLAEDLTSQFYFLGVRSLHAEDHTVVFVFRREDGTGEETGHHTRCELLLLSSSLRSGLSVLHGLLGSLGTEEERQGLREEILGVHPRMTELVVGELLHTADALLIEELHIVTSVAIEEIISTHTEPEQTDLAVRISSVVIDIRQCGRGE